MKLTLARTTPVNPRQEPPAADLAAAVNTDLLRRRTAPRLAAARSCPWRAASASVHRLDL